MTQAIANQENTALPVPDVSNQGASNQKKQDIWRGIKAVAPLLPGIVPFAMIAGSSAVEVGISIPAALGMSLFIFAGASQLVFVEMWAREAPAIVLLATVLLVNLRFSMYSAMIAPFVRGWKLSRKSLLAYLLTDHASLLSLH
jgi:predicted branched-subunit amino acid permease